MEKQFIPYEQSLALKELGFEEKCVSVYLTSNKQPYPIYRPYTNKEQTDELLRPLYQQAFDFFREEYDLWQIVQQNTDKDWTYDIMPIIGIMDYKLFDVFDTYEEARLGCLKKLIEIVKEKV
tara:strand:- start:2942 stop:3307 length:366 start_codon:yes stop_codon:yes gene_type:complete